MTRRYRDENDQDYDDDEEGSQPPRRRSLLVRVLRLLAGSLLVAGLATTLAVVIYAIPLDATVREKFEGKRWALPARVYARPLELYAGAPLSPEELLAELKRLDYRELAEPPRPGTYQGADGYFLIRTRGFQFWDGAEPERFIAIQIDDDHISSITNAGDDGEEPALVRLDPVMIDSIYPIHNEDRVLVQASDLPPLLIDTLKAVEDRTFGTHVGVDPLAILRASIKNFQAGAVVEGGSTLTQQLVKNFYLTDERSLERKINEALMAILLELRYPKEDILEAYANEIYLGQDGSRAIHGFGLASRFYYNRELGELGVPETALLIALIKGPSFYDPRRHPERATERRNLVIDVMADQGIIDLAQAETTKAAPLGVGAKGGRPAGVYPAFTDLVRRQLKRDYREEDLRSEGLIIFTTLSPTIQGQAERAVREGLPVLEKLRKFKPGTLEGAAVVASAAQGEVLALVGGREADYAGFNRALEAVRPIGSLVKPMIYLEALNDPKKYNIASPLNDNGVNLAIGDGKYWAPRNYDGKTHGQVPLYLALAKSYNLATVNLGLELGLDRVIKRFQDLGVQRKIEKVPAMLLGSISLSPVEVAQVYQSIAASGFRAPLRAIRDVLNTQGEPLNRYPLAVESASSPQAAYLLTWAMRQVVQQGTATWLKTRLPKDLEVAGKTGTTNELRDSWFAGFSGDKVIVAWVGRDDNQPTGLTGGTGALRIWGDIMANIDSQPLPDFPPDGIEMVNVDRYNGRRAPRGCGRAMSLPFDANALPTKTSDCGAAPPPDTKADEAPAAAPPRPKEEKKDSGGGIGGFLRDFLGN
ncbi:MAG: penicillin-binding protein 1B [Chromatiaceae bacterium]|nr:penicillin-binding protein 1B [Chromatiaceae bacterium]